jgi:hypothetical protein
MEVVTRNYALSCIRCEVAIAEERPTSFKEAVLYGQDHREHIPPTGSVNLVTYANTLELGEFTAVLLRKEKEEVKPCVT